MTGMLRAAINDPALLESERARQIMGPLVSIKCQHGNVSTAIAVELRAALLRGHRGRSVPVKPQIRYLIPAKPIVLDLF